MGEEVWDGYRKKFYNFRLDKTGKFRA